MVNGEWPAQLLSLGDCPQVGSGLSGWLTGILSLPCQARKLGNKELGPRQSIKKGFSMSSN